MANLQERFIALTAFLILSIVSTFGLRGYATEKEDADTGGRSRLSSSQRHKQDAETTVDDIIEKSLTAYGGRAKLQEFANNCLLSGHITDLKEGGGSLPYKHVRKDGHWRIEKEVRLQGGDGSDSSLQVSAFDGSICWVSAGGTTSALASDEARMLIDREKRQPFMLTNWLEPAAKFRLLGRTTYKHVPVWSIEVESAGEPSTTIYLDQTNYLVVALAYSLNDPKRARPVNVAVEYSENRPALGIIWPYKQTELVGDKPVEEIYLENCASADQLASDYFAKPGEAPTVRLSKVINVPFDYTQREIVLKGRIDGSEEVVLLFDTGSSETIIDRRVAAQQFLTKGADFKIAAAGGEVSSQTTMVKRLEMGNLIANDVQARLLDLTPQSRQLGKPIAGIVGMNVIGNYLVTIDYSKPAITFADAIVGIRPTELNAVPFTQGAAPVVRVTLAGNDPVEFLMDTGAAFNHLPAYVAKRHLGKEKTQQSKHVTEGTGLDGRPLRLGTITIDPVSIGSQILHRVSFTYPVTAAAVKPVTGDQDSGARAGAVESEQQVGFGILGNPFWQNFVVIIDSRFQRLLLKANPQATVRTDMETAIVSGDTALFTRRDFRSAEYFYQRAAVLADNAQDVRYQATAQGRLGNLRRIMAHDLKRPEHAKASYNYFSKAHELARKADLKNVEGRILADWSLLYSDNGQPIEARQAIDKAISLAPHDACVNVDYAVHLFRNHLFPEAQKYIEKALFLDSGNWQALWYQVKLSEMFADLKKQKETLAEIVKYYPWSKVAQDKLKAVSTQVK